MRRRVGRPGDAVDSSNMTAYLGDGGCGHANVQHDAALHSIDGMVGGMGDKWAV